MITWPLSTAGSQVAPRQSVSDEFSGTYSTDLNRVLSAAVVNRRFCNLLLSDPQAALRNGYNGETFQLSDNERQIVMRIRAGSLQEFASQLIAEFTGEGHGMTDEYTQHPYHNETAASLRQFA
jgi:hypothetical protein